MRVLGLLAATAALALTGLAGCGGEARTASRLVAPYYAKELCSCLFVAGQPEDACLDYVRHDLADIDAIPLVDTDDDATIDYEDRSVRVDLLLNSATARHEGDRLGCRLQD